MIKNILTASFYTLVYSSIISSDYCLKKASTFIFAPCIQCMDGYKLKNGKCQMCPNMMTDQQCRKGSKIFYGTNTGVSYTVQKNKQNINWHGQDPQIKSLILRLKKHIDDPIMLRDLIQVYRSLTQQNQHKCLSFDEYGCVQCRQGYRIVEMVIDTSKNHSQLLIRRCIQSQQQGNYRQVGQDSQQTSDDKQHEIETGEEQKLVCQVYSQKQNICKVCRNDQGIIQTQFGQCINKAQKQKNIAKKQAFALQKKNRKLKSLNNPNKGLIIQKMILKPTSDSQSFTLSLPINKYQKANKSITIYVVQQKYLSQQSTQLPISNTNKSKKQITPPYKTNYVIYDNSDLQTNTQQSASNSLQNITDQDTKHLSEQRSPTKFDETEYMKNMDQFLQRQTKYRRYKPYGQFSSKQFDGCIKYSRQGVCEKCSFLFYLSKSSHKCLRYDPNCKSFDRNQALCKECFEDYILVQQRCSLKS